MSKETFMYICSKLSPALARTDTLMRKCLSVECRVAITNWCLATPIEYHTIAHLFGIERSTVCEIVHETCHCIVDVLLKEHIKFPTSNHLSTVVEEFIGVPPCFGAIDGCYIPISAPNLMHTDYYNRKGWYSMLIQGVVDANYRFLDVCVGWPGSVHDARVFAQSTLYDNIEHYHILLNNAITVSGVRIPLYLIGDSAYPLKLWLIKPFAHNTDVTSDQRNYNYRMCRVQITVEIAFGRLKGRWCRLMKRNDMNVDKIPCCLASFTIYVHGEHFNDTWLQNVDSNYDQPETVARDTVTGPPQNVRNALIRILSTKLVNNVL